MILIFQIQRIKINNTRSRNTIIVTNPKELSQRIFILLGERDYGQEHTFFKADWAYSYLLGLYYPTRDRNVSTMNQGKVLKNGQDICLYFTTIQFWNC